MDYEEKTDIIGRKSHTSKRKKFNFKMKYNILNSLITSLIIFFFFCIVYIFWLQINMEKGDLNLYKINNINNNINTNDEKKEVIDEEQKDVIFESGKLTKEIMEFDESLPPISQKEISDFRKLISENKLLENKKYKVNNKPDITVIITMRNQAHCIHKAIRSVQNQSFKNIEILILLDCSSDNSTETINNYIKEDKRIKLINHDTIEGTMKIRTEGIKLAKGKYITFLDGDDSYMHKEVLNNSWHIANMGNLDIVEFYGAEYRKGKSVGFTHLHRESVGIIYQPEIRDQFINLKIKKDVYRPIRCRNIWGKLIKKEVFLKTLKNMGSKYTDDFIVEFEDTMMRISLFQVAKSFYLIKKQPGYYYSRDEKLGRFPDIKGKKCKNRENVLKYVDGIKFLQFLMEKFEDNEFEQKAIFYELLSIKVYELRRYYKYLGNNYDKLYNIIDKIAKIKYLNEEEKKKIEEIRNEVKRKEDEKNKKKKKLI